RFPSPAEGGGIRRAALHEDSRGDWRSNRNNRHFRDEPRSERSNVRRYTMKRGLLCPVVLAILGTLGVILFPVFSLSREKASVAYRLAARAPRPTAPLAPDPQVPASEPVTGLPHVRVAGIARALASRGV